MNQPRAKEKTTTMKIKEEKKSKKKKNNKKKNDCQPKIKYAGVTDTGIFNLHLTKFIFN